MRVISITILAFFVLAAPTPAYSASLQPTSPETSEAPITTLKIDVELQDVDYLDGAEVTRARILRFLEKRATIKERHKVNYLIGAIKSSKAMFHRNGMTYNGSKASRWLRWKMRHPQYALNPIRTGDDFVHLVCDRSKKTGQPYEMKLTNGKRVNLETILTNELAALENAILKRTLATVSASASTASNKDMESISVPIMLPAPVTAA